MTNKIKEYEKEITKKISKAINLNLLNFYYGFTNGKITTLYFEARLISFKEYNQLILLIETENDKRFKQLMEEKYK